MSCTCPTDQLSPRITLRGAGTRRLAQSVRLVCRQCAAVWIMDGTGSRGSLVFAREADVKKKQPPPPAAKSPSTNRTFAKFADEWQAHGGSVPDWLAPKLVRVLTTLKPDKRLLILGAAGGLIPYTLDRAWGARAGAGGAAHAVVEADAATRARLQPLLSVTECHDVTWRPDYGVLFHCILIAGPLTDEWRTRVPSLLVPGGDCWLVGPDAQPYATELAAKWGYAPRIIERDTVAEYRRFLHDDRPLGAGPGTELHDAIARMRMPECQACRNLAHRMNAWGVAGCRERLELIVDEMLPRARDWWANTDHRQKLAAWFASRESQLSKLQQALQTAKSAAKNAAQGLLKSQQEAAAAAQAEIDRLLRDLLSEQITMAITAAETAEKLARKTEAIA